MRRDSTANSLMNSVSIEKYSTGCCKKSDEDFEDLDEDIYCSIAVTKHM